MTEILDDEIFMQKVKNPNRYIKRDKAELHMQELLQTCYSINNELDIYKAPMFIKNLIVFGSYLSEKERLGDIDLFVEFHIRWEDKRQMVNYFAKMYNSRANRNLGYYYTCAQHHMYKLLRNKKNFFSFHEMDEYETFLREYGKDFKSQYLIKDFNHV